MCLIKPVRNKAFPVRKQAGFTLIEAMVAFFVLSVGLLATLKMIAVSQQYADAAGLHMHAAFLGRSIIENMRANPDAIKAGDYDTGENTTHTSADTCVIGGCSAAQIALMDLVAWKQALAASFASGKGSVSVAADTVTVSISWTDRAFQESQTMSFAL
jgi:type IV pilus assembly protein PilV